MLEEIPHKPVLAAIIIGLSVWSFKPDYYTPKIDLNYTAGEKKGKFSKKEVDTTLVKLGSAQTRRVTRYSTYPLL